VAVLATGGLATWDVTTDQVTPATDPPAGFEGLSCVTSAGTWLGKAGDKIARHTAAGWTQPTFPAAAPTFIYSFACSGEHAMILTDLGLIASADDGQTWTSHVIDEPDINLRELQGLPDGRFILFSSGGSRAHILDATGALVAKTEPLPGAMGERFSCDDGLAFPKVSQYTPDFGVTWLPIVGGAGPAPLGVGQGFACGGGTAYYYLAASRYATWVRADSLGADPVTIGLVDDPMNQVPVGLMSHPLVRLPDGDFFGLGLRWHEGDADWSRFELGSDPLAIGADLFHVIDGRFEVSHDGGATWGSAGTLPPHPPGITGNIADVTLGASSDGTLYYGFTITTVSPGTNVPFTNDYIFESNDHGTTFHSIYEATNQNILLGVAPDGALISSGHHVSRDHAASWLDTTYAPTGFAAAVAPSGDVIANMPTGPSLTQQWHVFDSAGSGDELAQFDTVTIDGIPVTVGAQFRPAFDADGHLYILAGMPLPRLYRSDRPVVTGHQGAGL
jgi:hypothetical protein